MNTAPKDVGPPSKGLNGSDPQLLEATQNAVVVMHNNESDNGNADIEAANGEVEVDRPFSTPPMGPTTETVAEDGDDGAPFALNTEVSNSPTLADIASFLQGGGARGGGGGDDGGFDDDDDVGGLFGGGSNGADGGAASAERRRELYGSADPFDKVLVAWEIVSCPQVVASWRLNPRPQERDLMVHLLHGTGVLGADPLVPSSDDDDEEADTASESSSAAASDISGTDSDDEGGDASMAATLRDPRRSSVSTAANASFSKFPAAAQTEQQSKPHVAARTHKSSAQRGGGGGSGSIPAGSTAKAPPLSTRRTPNNNNHGSSYAGPPALSSSTAGNISTQSKEEAMLARSKGLERLPPLVEVCVARLDVPATAGSNITGGVVAGVSGAASADAFSGGSPFAPTPTPPPSALAVAAPPLVLAPEVHAGTIVRLKDLLVDPIAPIIKERQQMRGVGVGVGGGASSPFGGGVNTSGAATTNTTSSGTPAQQQAAAAAAAALALQQFQSSNTFTTAMHKVGADGHTLYALTCAEAQSIKEQMAAEAEEQRRLLSEMMGNDGDASPASPSSTTTTGALLSAPWLSGSQRRGTMATSPTGGGGARRSSNVALGGGRLSSPINRSPSISRAAGGGPVSPLQSPLLLEATTTSTANGMVISPKRGGRDQQRRMSSVVSSSPLRSPLNSTAKSLNGTLRSLGGTLRGGGGGPSLIPASYQNRKKNAAYNADGTPTGYDEEGNLIYVPDERATYFTETTLEPKQILSNPAITAISTSVATAAAAQMNAGVPPSTALAAPAMLAAAVLRAHHKQQQDELAAMGLNKVSDEGNENGGSPTRPMGGPPKPPPLAATILSSIGVDFSHPAYADAYASSTSASLPAIPPPLPAAPSSASHRYDEACYWGMGKANGRWGALNQSKVQLHVSQKNEKGRGRAVLGMGGSGGFARSSEIAAGILQMGFPPSSPSPSGGVAAMSAPSNTAPAAVDPNAAASTVGAVDAPPPATGIVSNYLRPMRSYGGTDGGVGFTHNNACTGNTSVAGGGGPMSGYYAGLVADPLAIPATPASGGPHSIAGLAASTRHASVAFSGGGASTQRNSVYFGGGEGALLFGNTANSNGNFNLTVNSSSGAAAGLLLGDTTASNPFSQAMSLNGTWGGGDATLGGGGCFGGLEAVLNATAPMGTTAHMNSVEGLMAFVHAVNAATATATAVGVGGAPSSSLTTITADAILGGAATNGMNMNLLVNGGASSAAPPFIQVGDVGAGNNPFLSFAPPPASNTHQSATATAAAAALAALQQQHVKYASAVAVANTIAAQHAGPSNVPMAEHSVMPMSTASGLFGGPHSPTNSPRRLSSPGRAGGPSVVGRLGVGVVRPASPSAGVRRRRGGSPSAVRDTHDDCDVLTASVPAVPTTINAKPYNLSFSKAVRQPIRPMVAGGDGVGGYGSGGQRRSISPNRSSSVMGGRGGLSSPPQGARPSSAQPRSKGANDDAGGGGPSSPSSPPQAGGGGSGGVTTSPLFSGPPKVNANIRGEFPSDPRKIVAHFLSQPPELTAATYAALAADHYGYLLERALVTGVPNAVTSVSNASVYINFPQINKSAWEALHELGRPLPLVLKNYGFAPSWPLPLNTSLTAALSADTSVAAIMARPTTFVLSDLVGHGLHSSEPDKVAAAINPHLPITHPANKAAIAAAEKERDRERHAKDVAIASCRVQFEQQHAMLSNVAQYLFTLVIGDAGGSYVIVPGRECVSATSPPIPITAADGVGMVTPAIVGKGFNTGNDPFNHSASAAAFGGGDAPPMNLDATQTPARRRGSVIISEPINVNGGAGSGKQSPQPAAAVGGVADPSASMSASLRPQSAGAASSASNGFGPMRRRSISGRLGGGKRGHHGGAEDEAPPFYPYNDAHAKKFFIHMGGKFNSWGAFAMTAPEPEPAGGGADDASASASPLPSIPRPTRKSVTGASGVGSRPSSAVGGRPSSALGGRTMISGGAAPISPTRRRSSSAFGGGGVRSNSGNGAGGAASAKGQPPPADLLAVPNRHNCVMNSVCNAFALLPNGTIAVAVEAAEDEERCAKLLLEKNAAATAAAATVAVGARSTNNNATLGVHQRQQQQHEQGFLQLKKRLRRRRPHESARVLMDALNAYNYAAMERRAAAYARSMGTTFARSRRGSAVSAVSGGAAAAAAGVDTSFGSGGGGAVGRTVSSMSAGGGVRRTVSYSRGATSTSSAERSSYNPNLLFPLPLPPPEPPATAALLAQSGDGPAQLLNLTTMAYNVRTVVSPKPTLAMLRHYPDVLKAYGIAHDGTLLAGGGGGTTSSSSSSSLTSVGVGSAAAALAAAEAAAEAARKRDAIIAAMPPVPVGLSASSTVRHWMPSHWYYAARREARRRRLFNALVPPPPPPMNPSGQGAGGGKGGGLLASSRRSVFAGAPHQQNMLLNASVGGGGGGSGVFLGIAGNPSFAATGGRSGRSPSTAANGVGGSSYFNVTSPTPRDGAVGGGGGGAHDALEATAIFNASASFNPSSGAHPPMPLTARPNNSAAAAASGGGVGDNRAATPPPVLLSKNPPPIAAERRLAEQHSAPLLPFAVHLQRFVGDGLNDANVAASEIQWNGRPCDYFKPIVEYLHPRGGNAAGNGSAAPGGAARHGLRSVAAVTAARRGSSSVYAK